MKLLHKLKWLFFKPQPDLITTTIPKNVDPLPSKSEKIEKTEEIVVARKPKFRLVGKNVHYF